MLALERYNNILKLLAERGQISTNELSEILNVSATTVRNDLNKLSEDNLLIKTHGGAALLTSTKKPQNQESYLFHKREEVNKEEKEAISDSALQYIENNQCIILDASSTSLALAKKLDRFQRLTVVTNGIYSMLALKEMPNVTVIFIGGIVTKYSGSTEGLLGSDLLNQINADIAFVSAHGFTLEEGLTDFNIYEVELKKQMLKHSRRCIALLDHTKFDTISTSSFSDDKLINLIITDGGIDPNVLKKYRENGISIEISQIRQ